MHDYEAGFMRVWRCTSATDDVPPPAPQYQFDPARKWRFDFAWPMQKIAVELEGLTRQGGRHQRRDGYARDCEKYRAAALAGWLVLRYPAADMQTRPVQLVEDVAAAVRDAMRRRRECIADQTTPNS